MALTKVTYSMISGASANVMDYGATGNGTTDDSSAIRLALDYIGGLINGGTVYFPPGTYYVASKIFIPQTPYLCLRGSGAILLGQGKGTGIIFETGAQTYSTGGTTNIGFPETYLHYNQIISGLKFQNCQIALNLYNMLEGCSIENNEAQPTVVTLIQAQRCFYCDVINNKIQSFTAHTSPYTSADAAYIFSDNVNVMTIEGNSVSDAKAGFLFTNGTSAIFASNNSAESCDYGLVIGGEVYNAEFNAFYLEGNTYDIYIQDGNGKSMIIDNCWTTSSNAVYAETWIGGELGKNMSYSNGATVNLTGIASGQGVSLNSCSVWVPSTISGASGDYSENTVPSTWYLNSACTIHTNSNKYIDATGPSAAIYGLQERYLGASNLIVPRYFKGTSNLIYGPPYTLTTNTTFGTAVILTKIAYSTYECGIRFDFSVLDNSTTRQIAGWIIGTTVFRNDSNSQTVVASNNSGFYQLTLSGFSTASAINVIGGIRIV